MSALSVRVAKLELVSNPEWLNELDALLLRVLGDNNPCLPERLIENAPKQPIPQSFDELVEIALAKP